MKRILGLDLGTTSIGWAYVHEAENENEQSKIVRLGVRINQLDNFDKVDKSGKVSESKNPSEDFASGKGLSPNAGRTQKRGARRNLQRFKQRRDNLIDVLKKNNIISNGALLTEDGKRTTFNTLELRAKAATEKVELDEFARILLLINKKRGYKSSRKAKNEDEGQVIDGMAIAVKLYEENLTPGQYCYNLLKNGKRVMPDFYRSDLKVEFDKVWNLQKQFYPDVLTDEFYKQIEGQGQQNTRKRFLAIKDIYTAENKGKRDEVKLKAYQWRCEAIEKQLDISEVAYVITEINNDLNKSSGYLGAISDRSKVLYFNKITVGQYLYSQVLKNPHTRLKGQVFYRQDYLDEFEKIWETQSQYYPQLTHELKEEIRDIIIFYQRRLKSQKGLIGFCELESKEKEVIVDGKPKTKTIGSRVIPKSSPLFQEFKIWQNLSNVVVKNKKTKELYDFDLQTRQQLFDELNIRGKLTKAEVLKLIVDTPKEWDLNFKELEGNRTNRVLYDAYLKILEHEGNDLSFTSNTVEEIKEAVSAIFDALKIDKNILEFNAELDGAAFEKQASFKLWHLLYSYEGDKSNTGNDALFRILKEQFGFEKEYASFLIDVDLQDDYGSLSAKAIRKILPFLKENVYSDACELAGYNHSHSLTKEENEKRELKDKLDLLPKNSLRNPVVEKIINQLVNVINAIIDDPEMGKPDEIRIELARELKKNAKERAEMTTNINKAKTEHEKYRKILQDEFGIKNPTRNDIIRYKLYIELETTGYKSLYTNTYIPREKLFSKEIDIEHIIPKARLFDDSFSNKTLEYRQANIDKSDETAFDYVKNALGAEALVEYESRVNKLFNNGVIGKAKYKKLLMTGDEIGEGFIERDLRESQYIAKKARAMLLEICRSVVATTGSITDTLREDWGLINTMKELNLDKYRTLGLIEKVEKKDGTLKEQIIDWTKRNDHRHHAMDALTVAFTKHNHIQYLNNLNARRNEHHKKHSTIIAIEQKETFRDENGKRSFKSPMPQFRNVAKEHLENVLISHKAKNKVVTRNRNKVKGSDKVQIVLTPRGQLHKETVYGQLRRYETKLVKIGPSFDSFLIAQVANKVYREALELRMQENENNPKKAFGGKNSPAKNPILTSKQEQLPEKVKLAWLAEDFTVRKEVTPDLKIDKVIDSGIKRILEKRLKDFGGQAKDAFSNLDKNPIWLNKEKGIAIKRVTISGVNNAEPLHYKKDKKGTEIKDEKGKPIPADFVSTGNNHHVAIYRDEKGNLQEEVVSFYEAVARVNANVPVINKNHEKGWEFLFSMKQNEMFVFPSDDFTPNEIDLLNPDNYGVISPNMFRVQKFGNISTSGIWFRHHLETNVEVRKELKDTTYKVIQATKNLKDIIKVRTNHLGKIVHVGEY